MTFNIGVTIGPSIGGMLSDLAGSYPNTFGKVPLFVNFPYAAPNLFSACILFCGITFTWLCLEEVCCYYGPLPKSFVLIYSCDVFVDFG